MPINVENSGCFVSRSEVMTHTKSLDQYTYDVENRSILQAAVI